MKNVIIMTVSAAINTAKQDAYNPVLIKRLPMAYAFLSMRYAITPINGMVSAKASMITDTLDHLSMLIQQEKAVGKINMQNHAHNVGMVVNVKRFNNQSIEILQSVYDLVEYQQDLIRQVEKACN